MINHTDIGDRLTGLLILATAIPETIRDANGDPIREELVADIRDLAAELGVGDEVRWSAHGEPADVLPVSAGTLRRLQVAASTMTEALDEVPELGGRLHE
ncbi:hypothetical protein [Lacticaseibacillus daqingensis]|uniref:hypothetical protein n=1 Tax=Lacticaseibacillus daqingensis TaxID=2486014 RepID=UPI000F7B519B|nr:hypothetical protein [Lacticaseibacillus daqingensis]